MSKPPLYGMLSAMTSRTSSAPTTTASSSAAATLAVGREQKYRGAAVGSMIRVDLDPDPSGSAGDHSRVGKYLDETGVAEGFTNLLCGLIKHQPDQQREWKIREDDWRREAQERARQHEFWATKARNLSAWAPKGMG